MNEIQKQQALEQQTYQFRVQLEQLQEDQLAIKKGAALCRRTTRSIFSAATERAGSI
ncbi:hypothetical protein [Enterococcus sp. AZ192]|uniref:hypothetical protein n=1 Tax=unclassified Enterococcus TaxID=2608891 RepID=UPI003D27411A